MPAADTIVHRFFKQAEIRPNAPAYHVKVGGAWRVTSWKEYAAQVREAARALLALGVGHKHGNGVRDGAACVCILGFNRPEWAVMDLATMAVGGAPAGIYTTCSAPEVAYIIGHTEARVVLVENEAQYQKVAQEKHNLPKLEQIVLMQGANANDPLALSWQAFIDKGKDTAEDVLQAHIDALDPARLATLIYTSGTTGPPKGVMLSHKNLAWTAQQVIDCLGIISPGDLSLSYLPLSHIAEQMFSIHLPATAGSQIYFAESIDKIAENIKDVRPTVVFGVPRIWEKMHEKITQKLGQRKGWKAAALSRLFEAAQQTGKEVNALRNGGKEPGGLLALRYKLFAELVYNKVKRETGLDRAKICVSGAAPIAAEVIQFFAGLDIVIREVYGQSEDTGPTSFNRPAKTKFGSVGPVFPGVEVKIAEDEEILVKGDNVFLGYYKEPEATAEALKDGWLYSGDLGRIDAEGFLHITGRKKDLIITAGGKNIAPKNIEAALKMHPLVAEAVVIGDRRKYLSALISLAPEAAAAFAQDHDLAKDKLAESPQLIGVLQEHIDHVNRELARVEQIKKFAVCKRPFSVEGGPGRKAELTPTLKVKRKVVHENYAAEIETMYAEDDKLVAKSA